VFHVVFGDHGLGELGAMYANVFVVASGERVPRYKSLISIVTHFRLDDTVA
jgi:hypothetical protein